MSKGPYTKAGRLADVLALIQVLALDPYTKRTEPGLNRELQGAPSSAPDWFSVAKEHRELFRVQNADEPGLSLVARHVLPSDGGKRPPLEPEFVSKLIEAAINLHDRQVNAAERWRSFMPAVIGLVSGVIASLVTVIGAHYIADHQADLQRKQLIVDRRITAVKDFAEVSWRGPAERSMRIIALRDRIRGLPDCSAAAERRCEALVTDYNALVSTFTHWGAEQASQAVITSALTHSEAPRHPNLSLTIPLWELLRTENPRVQSEQLRNMFTDLETLFDKDTQFNIAVQAYVSKVSQSITSPD